MVRSSLPPAASSRRRPGIPALMMLMKYERTDTQPARAGRAVCRSIRRATRCTTKNVIAMQHDAAVIDIDVAAIQTDVAAIEIDVAAIGIDVAAMRSDVAAMRSAVVSLRPPAPSITTHEDARRTDAFPDEFRAVAIRSGVPKNESRMRPIVSRAVAIRVQVRALAVLALAIRVFTQAVQLSLLAIRFALPRSYPMSSDSARAPLRSSSMPMQTRFARSQSQLSPAR
jgi:hypothetical protein